MIDSLIECPLCGSTFCYHSVSEGVGIYSCLTCGFTTNSHMMTNTDFTKAYEELLPQLYLDIKQVKDGLVWYPNTVNKVEEGRGIIFANGVDKDNWVWTYAPSALIPEEDKEKFKTKSGEYLKYKTDMLNAKHFNRYEFGLAIAELEIL